MKETEAEHNSKALKQLNEDHSLEVQKLSQELEAEKKQKADLATTPTYDQQAIENLDRQLTETLSQLESSKEINKKLSATTETAQVAALKTEEEKRSMVAEHQKEIEQLTKQLERSQEDCKLEKDKLEKQHQEKMDEQSAQNRDQQVIDILRRENDQLLEKQKQTEAHSKVDMAEKLGGHDGMQGDQAGTLNGEGEERLPLEEVKHKETGEERVVDDTIAEQHKEINQLKQKIESDTQKFAKREEDFMIRIKDLEAEKVKQNKESSHRIEKLEQMYKQKKSQLALTENQLEEAQQQSSQPLSEADTTIQSGLESTSEVDLPQKNWQELEQEQCSIQLQAAPSTFTESHDEETNLFNSEQLQPFQEVTRKLEETEAELSNQNELLVQAQDELSHLRQMYKQLQVEVRAVQELRTTSVQTEDDSVAQGDVRGAVRMERVEPHTDPLSLLPGDNDVSAVAGTQHLSGGDKEQEDVHHTLQRSRNVSLDIPSKKHLEAAQSAGNVASEHDEEYFDAPEMSSLRQEAQDNRTDAEKLRKESEGLREEVERLILQVRELEVSNSNLKEVIRTASIEAPFSTDGVLEGEDPEIKFTQMRTKFIAQTLELEETHKTERQQWSDKYERKKQELIEKIEEKDKENKELRRQHSPRAHPVTSRSLSYEELPEDVDPRIQIGNLKQVLQSKKEKIEELNVQVKSFQEIASQHHLLHTNNKAQSLKMVELQRDLKRVQEERDNLDEEVHVLQGEVKGQLSDQLSRLPISPKSFSAKVSHADLEAKIEVLSAEVNEWKSHCTILQSQLDTLTPQGVGVSLEGVPGEKEAMIKYLEHQLTLVQKENGKLQDDVKELEQKLDNVKTERDNLSKQNLELFAVKNTYKEQFSEMENLKSEVAVTREALSSLVDQMAAKATEMSDLKEEKEALQKELDDLKGELVARRLQAGDFEEDFKKERQDRENMAGRIDDEKAELNLKIQRIVENVKSANEQLDRVREMNTTLEVEKANLEADLTEQEKKISKLQESIRGYTKQLTCHEQSYLEVKDKLEEERQSKEQLENEVAKHQEQINIAAAEKLSLQEQLNVVETNYKLKEKYLEIMAAEKSNLEDQVGRMNAQYSASQLELTDCRKQLETTIADISRLSDERRKLDDQVGKTTARYNALQLEFTDCREQLETTIADTSRLSDEVLAKTQQVRHYKKQTDSYKATLDDTADKLDETTDRLKETTGRLENTQRELQDRKDCIQRMEEDHQQQIEIVKAQLESDRLMAVTEVIDAQRAKSNKEIERQTQAMDGQKAGQMADMLKAETTIKEELEQKYSLLLDKSDSQFKAIQKLKQILAANGIPVPALDIEMISGNIKSGESSGSPVLHSSQQPRPAESRRRVSPTDQSFAQPRRVQNTPHPTRNPSQYNQPAPSDQYPPTGQKVEQTEQELSAMRHPPPHGVEPYSSGYNAASQYGHDNYRGHGAPQNIQDHGNRLEGGGAPGDRHVQVVQGQDLPFQQGRPPSQTPQRQDYYHSGIDIATPLAAGYNPQVHHPNVVETARRETGDRVAQYHSPAGQHHQTKPPGLGYPQTSQDSPAGQSCPQQGHPQANLSYRQQGPPQASQIYPQQGTPQAIHPQQGHPQTSQSYSQQGPPQAIHPHQGQPQTNQGFPQQGHPQASQKYLQQGHLQANQGYPPQGPPQGYPANSGYPQMSQPFNYPTKSQPGDIHDQYNPGSTIGNSRDTQCDNSGYTPPSDETRGMDSLISDSVGTQAAGPPSPHPHKMAAQPRQEIPQTAPPPTQTLLPVKPERPRAVVDDSIRENILLEGIDEDIENVAKEFEVTDEDEDQDTSLTGVPVDPNLVCPLCLRQFKLGEIQKYKRHVSKCDGKP